MNQSVQLQKQSQFNFAVDNLLKYNGNYEIMSSEMWDEWVVIVFGGK